MAGGGIETLREIVRHERDAQLAHMESLDSKAGLVLGFAGTLVALAGGSGILADVGRRAAALAAALALSAFFPRRYPRLDLAWTRLAWIRLPAEEAVLRVVDAEIGMVGQMARVPEKKGLRVKLAMLALWSAVALFFAGILTG
jgi:hypothetical protein